MVESACVGCGGLAVGRLKLEACRHRLAHWWTPAETVEFDLSQMLHWWIWRPTFTIIYLSKMPYPSFTIIYLSFPLVDMIPYASENAPVFFQSHQWSIWVTSPRSTSAASAPPAAPRSKRSDLSSKWGQAGDVPGVPSLGGWGNHPIGMGHEVAPTSWSWKSTDWNRWFTMVYLQKAGDFGRNQVKQDCRRVLMWAIVS